ncbi:MAG: YraN family protein [Oscillospiraceae bacterium]|nr:YraN family protein [Oscillospiraceae bacterium]MBQ7012732.1 YraN family protein [Oscillospiraceae bacterium]
MKPSEIGRMGEDAVCYYLEALGYEILSRNFRVRGGEIDIVASIGCELCFVEVKTRKLESMVDGFAAVTRTKQRRLIRAAYLYCEKFDMQDEEWYIRYDIAEVTTLHNRIVNIDYLENAFDETYFHDNSQIIF